MRSVVVLSVAATNEEDDDGAGVGAGAGLRLPVANEPTVARDVVLLPSLRGMRARNTGSRRTSMSVLWLK